MGYRFNEKLEVDTEPDGNECPHPNISTHMHGSMRTEKVKTIMPPRHTVMGGRA